MATTIQVPTADGWQLGVRIGRPAGTSRGVALLLHAMMVDGRSMDRGDDRGLAAVLRAHGWTTWTADFRGRGLSGPTPSEGADWRYADLVRFDVPALTRAAAAEGPVVVVGHSLGGHVAAASMAAGHAQAEALVGLAANVWFRHHEPSPLARLRKDASLRAFAGLARVVGRVPARRLGIGPADEARGYALDLARPWFTGRWGEGDEDWWAALARLRKPVLWVTANADDLLARDPAASRFGRGMPEVEVWHAGGGQLGVAADLDHMGLVTHPAAAPVHAAVASWMAGIVEPAEGPAAR